MGNVNFTSLNFTSAEKSKLDRELVDHLFMLKEQLEYTLSNLGMGNFNQKEIKVFAESLKVTGVVTFKDLAENSETLINGAYIKSGIFEGNIFRTFTEEPEDFANNYLKTNGAVHMYYVLSGETWEQAVKWHQEYQSTGGCTLLGGLELDDDGVYTTDTSTRVRLRLFAQNYKVGGNPIQYCSLKLSSEFRMSLEAQKSVFIYAAEEYITIEAPKIFIKGEFIVNDVVRS